MGMFDAFSNPWSGGSNPFERVKGMVTQGKETPWGSDADRGDIGGPGGLSGLGNRNTFDALFKGKDTPLGAGNQKGYAGVGSIAQLGIDPMSSFIGGQGADNPMVRKAANRWGGTVNRMVGLDDGSGANTPAYENPYENLPAFDPSAYKGFDTTQLSKTMQRDNAVRGARDQANAVAQMNQYGTLSSGQSNAAMGNLAAEGERAQQGISAQLARMSYDDALKQWAMERDRLSKAVNERNRQKQAAYEDQRAREMGDEATLGNLAGMAGSYFMGGA